MEFSEIYLLMIKYVVGDDERDYNKYSYLLNYKDKELRTFQLFLQESF